MLIILRGYCTPSLKLECFVCYFKIINTFAKNNAFICNHPQTFFAQVIKNARPRGKVAQVTIKLIPFPHVSEKNFEPTTFPWGRVSF